MHTIRTGYDPEIAIAPDGSAIYLTDRDLTDRSSSENYSLSVIDARDWHVISKLPSPDRIANIGVGASGMAVSADGRYVYIHKFKILSGRYQGPNGYSAPKTDHWWDIFDTKTQEFTSNPPHVADCGVAKAFPPMNASSYLAILCYELNALVFIDPGSGAVAHSIGIFNASAAHCSGDAAGATQAPDGTIYLVSRNGCIQSIDPVEMTVQNVFLQPIPEAARPVRPLSIVSIRRPLVSGVGPGASSSNYGNEVWVLDMETQSRIFTIPIEQTASSLTTSPAAKRCT